MAGRFSVDTVFGAKDEMSGPMGRMAAKATAFERALGRANKFADKGVAFAKTTALATAAAGVGVGALGVHFGKTGADFEEAISAVGAVGLQTRDQIADLEKKALELGASTKFTATQAANAMETMARAGFKNHEILAGVGGVLSAAAASGLEMEEVAGVVSNALKGMGLEADQAARVSDVLALASSRTNSTIGTLGESMKNLAPVARQLNIPFEQAVASVALLQDVGLDASEAGTATATMLSKLAAPTPQVAKAMKQLGIAFEDASGNALPLAGILKEFDKAAKKSGGNMKVLSFFTDLVGLRGQKAALNLKELFASGKVSTLVDELENAEGAAEKMAGLRMQNLKGDLEILASAVEGVQVSLFQLEGGPLRGIVQGMSDWVGENQKLIESEFHTYLEKSIKLVDNFTDGVDAGFDLARGAIDKTGLSLESVFGDESSGPSIKAYQLGQTVSRLAVVFGIYWAVTKAVTVATAAWSLVTGIAKGVQIAWAAAVTAARWAMFWWTFQSKAGAAATVAMSAASTIATGRLYAQAAAARVTSMSMAGLAKTAGAAALAIGAVMLANDQNEKLKQETGGKGILDVASDVAPKWLGGKGMTFLESADENLDKQAKERRREEDAAAARKKAATDPSNTSTAFDAAAFTAGDAAVPGLMGLQDQLKHIETLVGPPGAMDAAGRQPPLGLPAAAGAPTPQGPPVVSLKEESTAALSQNLSRDIKGALKGNVTVTLKDPGGQVDSVSSSGESIVLDHSGDL